MSDLRTAYGELAEGPIDGVDGWAYQKNPFVGMVAKVKAAGKVDIYEDWCDEYDLLPDEK